MAKSGKGGSTGSADGKGTAKERARLEKHLQKALDLEAKRRKQVSEATAGVKDLRAQLVALDGGHKVAPRGTSPVKAAAAKSALVKAGPVKAPAAGKSAATARTPATTAAAKSAPRGAGAKATTTRRSSGASTTRRTTRTRRSPAKATGDGTGPA